MNKRDKHIDTDHSDFFQEVEIPYEKTKDEMWDILSSRLDEATQKKTKTKFIFLPQVRMAAAALLLLLVGTFLFLRFYSTEIHSPKGEHLSHILPDGSKVELNAETSISYHPYWWSFNRKIKFEGEAFFTVEKGKPFSIVSNNGTTEVLGTSFNIFSRNNEYKVYCEKGKVKVTGTNTTIDLIVNPGEMAIINNENGDIKSIPSEQAIGWIEYKFLFTSEYIQNVIDELQRQYNVNIILDLDNPSEYLYSGYFTKSTSVKTSLGFICKSFNLTFVMISNNEYKVIQNK